MEVKLSRLAALLLSVVMMLSVLAGCGTNPAETPGSNTSAIGSDTPDNSDGVIVIGTNRNPIIFDPHNQSDMGSEAIIRHIYSPLVSLTPDGELHPCLASEWEIADDSMSITFKLRDDVKFHNGDPFTADDVKFSLERQFNLPMERQYVTLMDTVEVIDPYTVRVNLNTPAPGVFLTNISGAASTIVPKAYTEKMEAEGKEMGDAPIGTGPYKFVSFVSYDQVVLETWDEYWGDPKPANAGLTFKIITDDSARTIALETGEVDFLVETPTVDYDRIDGNSDLEVLPYDTAWMEYLCVNQSKAPFDDIRVRQALSHLIDRESIIAITENGHGTPLYTPAAKGDLSYCELENKYPYDVDAAKALLAEAGYPNGFDVEVYVNTGYREQTAVVLQQSFEQAGIHMSVKTMESAAYFEATARGDHALMLGSRNTDPDPEAGLGPLYRSTATGDEGNRWFLRDPKIDEYFDAALLPATMAERAEIYHEMHNYMMEQADTIPLYTKDNVISYKVGLTGAMLFPNGAHMYDQLHFE